MISGDDQCDVEFRSVTRHLGALTAVNAISLKVRRSAMLSGGQQQRVALARAFELKRIQCQVEITFIYVTQDQEEAL